MVTNNRNNARIVASGIYTWVRLKAVKETTQFSSVSKVKVKVALHDPNTASQKLQQHLNLLQNWMEQWKITVNPEKSSQITFTTKRTICPRVSISNFPIPIKQEVKYLGLHLDQKLSWQTHIKAKRRQLELNVRNINWLINRKSQLSLENKITIYMAIMKPVWTYVIELWGCSKPSNTKILQTFQSKTLRKLANSPWYISNITL
jgi:hypothetical protein